MRKVLYIIPSLELGGAEMLLINHLNKLNLEFYKPTLLIVGDKFSLVSQLNKNIDVIKINASKSNYLFKLPKIFKTVNRLKPDVIHSHLFKANLLSRFVGIFTNAIVINHYHGLSRWMSKPKLFFDKITQPLMDYGLVVSDKSYELRLQREKINTSKLKLVYNFINQFPESLKHEKFVGETLTLGMACRLIPLKNIPSVIKLVKFLSGRGMSVNLEIAGDGPEYNRISSLINELNLSKRVKLLGYKSDLKEFYKRINIYVVASETEDLPLSLAESMSYGCAIISSDVGGIKSIVNQGEGLIVNRFDDSYFETILNYIKTIDFELVYSKNRELSKSIFHFSTYSSKMKNLYAKNGR